MGNILTPRYSEEGLDTYNFTLFFSRIFEGQSISELEGAFAIICTRMIRSKEHIWSSIPLIEVLVEKPYGAKPKPDGSVRTKMVSEKKDPAELIGTEHYYDKQTIEAIIYKIARLQWCLLYSANKFLSRLSEARMLKQNECDTQAAQEFINAFAWFKDFILIYDEIFFGDKLLHTKNAATQTWLTIPCPDYPV